jgi:hypoxanthine phosphoribosyltransferase
VPARILRSFLKQPGSANIPIQAIGLSLYEKLTSDADVEEAGKTVTRTQWLDLSALGEMGSLVGKRILIVDEVDDTRTTLEYAVKELEKDVEVARAKFGGEEAQFSIFVLHVGFSYPFCVFLCVLTNWEPEQGQGEEGGASPRHAQQRTVPGGSYGGG